MPTKDIILQVSEETAEVMEEISEQLFGESEARFDEIVDAIEDSVKKIEELYSDFNNYVGNSNKLVSSNQTDILSRFKTILDTIIELKNEGNKQFIRIAEKNDQLVTVISDLPQLIRDVSQTVSKTSESAKAFDTTILQTVQSLADDLANIQEMQIGISNKIDSSDSSEKLILTLTKLSEIEREIQCSTKTLASISDTLDNCNTFISQISASVNTLHSKNEKILDLAEKHGDNLNGINEHNDRNTAVLLEKMGEVLTCLGNISQAVKKIADQQSEISLKQSDLERDVKYLKLPFYKKWFKKG